MSAWNPEVSEIVALLGGGAAAVAYLLWLGRRFAELDRKLRRLQDHCRACRQEVAARLAGRLPHTSREEEG